MDHAFCPGSKFMRQPKPDIFACPACGEEVEIWTDEIRGTCISCGTTVLREGTMNCLDWCKMGKDCVGEDAYQAYMKNKTISIREQLFKLLASQAKDVRIVDHTREVVRFAEIIADSEQIDWHIVLSAAILHDVGIEQALAIHGSAEGEYQELEGEKIARQLLLKTGFKMEDIDEICLIVANHHSPGRVETANYRVVHDADLLANLKSGSIQSGSAEEFHFLTESGRKLRGTIVATLQNA